MKIAVIVTTYLVLVLSSFGGAVDGLKAKYDTAKAKIDAKQLRIENFRTPIDEIMTIKRDGGETVLNIAYERREHMLYNVDVVLTFSEQRTYQ